MLSTLSLDLGEEVIVGSYTLHLYCDTPGCVNAECRHYSDRSYAPGEFYDDESGATARRRARKQGWSINLRTGTCFCPLCSRKKKDHGNV